MTKKSFSSGVHSRRFGVEIEHGHGLGTHFVMGLMHDINADLRSRHEREWTVGADGSGVELRTPILQGEEGFTTLRRIMDKLKETGAYVTRRDGLHVHHDAPEFVNNPRACIQLVRSWMNNLPSIHQLVAPARRGSGACPAWTPHSIEMLEGWANGTSRLAVGRNDLNLASLREHGSIEFRLHEGTLDADVAIAWIMFGQRFLADVLKRVRPIKATPSDAALMSRIRLNKDAQHILALKQAYAYTTPGMSYQQPSY